MDPRGGLACHCVLVETGGQISPTSRILRIHGPTASELAERTLLANRDSLFLALVVRLAMEFKDSKRMRYTSMLASSRRAANSDSAHRYQVLLEMVNLAVFWLRASDSLCRASTRTSLPIWC